MGHGMFGFVSGPRPLALAQSLAPPENSALMEIAGPWNRLPRPISVLSLFGLGRCSLQGSCDVTGQSRVHGPARVPLSA